MAYLDLSGHREHATQPAEGLRDAVGFAEGTNEVDIRVQQRPHALDIVGLPGVKVSTGDAPRRVIRTHLLSMLAGNCSSQDLPITRLFVRRPRLTTSAHNAGSQRSRDTLT